MGDGATEAVGLSAPLAAGGKGGDAELDAVVEALCAADERFPADPDRGGRRRPLPARPAVAAVVDDLRAALFPAHFATHAASRVATRHAAGALLERVEHELAEQVWRGLAFTCEHGGDRDRCGPCAEQARKAARALLTRLPSVRALLESDVRAAYDGDPAATFLDETLLCYPGVAAIVAHRIAHELHRLGVPMIPRIIADLSRASTGIDIHPGAEIGASFFIDHGTGVVIGETCSIGARVRIYQGVTLGARGFPSDDDGVPIKGLPRHPLVGDDVTIYAGATILGRVTIGRGATIGGNVWITGDVAPGARVTQVQSRPQSFELGTGI